MAKASNHHSSALVKTLLIGSSGTGKTGSLISLIKDGYELRFIDMDNGLDYLVNKVREECPQYLDQIDYITLRDKMVADPMKAAKVSGRAKAYTDAIKYMTKWDDDTAPAEWGEKVIFVLDSLTLFGRSAKRWAESMNPSAKDPRQWYGASQESVLNVLDLLTSEEFKTNVIVISHVDLVEQSDGTTKGFVSSIGKALGPKIPAVFNTLIVAEAKGSGEKVKRTLTTMPTALIDAKAPTDKLPKSLPLETGMATIFETLKGNKPKS